MDKNLLKVKLILTISILSISCIHDITRHFKDRSSYYSNYKKQSPSIDYTVRDLTFFPINGERFRLSELTDKKAVVLIMRDRDCPTSGKYGPLLARLETQYSKLGIQFIYIYVGQLDSLSHGKKDLKEFNFKAPYVIDIKQTIVNAVSAQTANEVLILTPKNRKLIYRGPLNDHHHSLKSVSTVKNNSVSSILNAIISGKKFTSKEAPAPGCAIIRPKIKGKVFYKDVAPIISKKCSVCHNPSGTSLIQYLNYEDVASRRSMFKYVVENDLMPPWYVDPNTGPWKNDISLTLKEKAMLLKWIDDGTPKLSKHLQPLWSEKKEQEKKEPAPDYVIHLPEKVIIPSEAGHVYKKFIIPTKFKEDKWIKSIKFRLKPKIAHHATMFITNSLFKPEHIENVRKYMLSYFITNIKLEKERERRNKETSQKDIGYRIPRNSKIVLEIHYESIGKKVIDDFTQIHISFYRNKPRYKTAMYIVDNLKFNIPAHASNYKVTTYYKMKQTASLLRVHVHSHLRGKANAIFITGPDRKRKRIFGLDPYVMNFEKTYKLKTPLPVPKDSILECISWFDNSGNNPVNPDPNKNVKAGLFFKDEMSQCYFVWLAPIDSNIKSLWLANPHISK